MWLRGTGSEWSRRGMHAYGRGLGGRRWSPGGVILALIVGVLLLAVVVTLLALALAGAILLGGAYLGYRVLRAVLTRQTPPARGGDLRRLTRDARGLLEIARTVDPLDRYLLAVNEFARLSGAVLALDPLDVTRGRAARRARELAEQVENLRDAVAEIERRLAADPAAAGALAGVWELSVACAELESYSHDLAMARRSPTLATVRAFIGRRTALIARRDALVDRLRDADLRRTPTATVGDPSSGALP
jgi:hypothetical protein